MKRLTIFAVMLAVLASCNKETQFATARIDFAVSDNTMTKVSTTEVQSAVEQAVHQLPVSISYGLIGQSSKNCSAGATVEVPVGKVKMRLEYYDGYPQISGDVVFYDEPYFIADSTVTFHSYYTEVVLRAEFNCAMVVIDPSETESVYLGNNELILADYGTFKAFYVYTDTKGSTAYIQVNAQMQSDFKKRTVTIDTAQLEYGKWYMLSPTGITSGTAEVDFEVDGFEEGGRI